MPNASGIGPESWLSNKYNSVSCVRVPNAFGDWPREFVTGQIQLCREICEIAQFFGDIPRELVIVQSQIGEICEIAQRFEGIGPVSWFSCKANVCRFVR